MLSVLEVVLIILLLIVAGVYLRSRFIQQEKKNEQAEVLQTIRRDQDIVSEGIKEIKSSLYTIRHLLDVRNVEDDVVIERTNGIRILPKEELVDNE